MSAWFSLESPWSIWLLIVLAHFVWQGALIGCFAWIGGKLLRRANAKWRYGVFTSALVLMALCLPIT